MNWITVLAAGGYSYLHYTFGVKMASLVNAIFVSSVATYLLLFPDPVYDDPHARIHASTWEANVLFSMSIGYFIWDLYATLATGAGFAFLFHACACMYAYKIFLTPFCQYDGITFLLFEVSTIWLDLYHLTKRPIYKLLFAVSFVGIRDIFGTYRILWHVWPLLVRTLVDPATQNTLDVSISLVLVTAFVFLNFYWTWEILKKALKK